MLPIATLSLLSALTAPVYEMTQPSPSPAVANVLPADTPLVGLINTKAEAWGALGRFQLFQTAFTAASQFLPPNLKFDYAKDVESWLGDEVAIAFLPKVGASEASLDSNFLMVAPVKNDKLLQPLLVLLKADTQRLKERQYKGITILELKVPAGVAASEVYPSPRKPNRSTPVQPSSKTELQFLPNAARKSMWKLEAVKSPNPLPPQEEVAPPSPTPNADKPNWLKRQPGLTIAILPGYIVTANTAKPIEQLIDAKGSATLAQNPQFQQTVQHSRTGQVLFTLYQNPTKFFSLLQDTSKKLSLPFPLPTADAISPEQLKEYSTINGFLSVQPEGLRFQINAYRQTPRLDKVRVLNTQAEKILTRMPAATYSATTGRNLNQQWQSLVAVFCATPELKDVLFKFRNLVSTTVGLDVDRDIMSWMDGEYAFFLFPTKGGLFRLLSPNFNLGVGLVVQTSNRTTANTTLKKLEQFVKSFSMGTVAINTRSIKGKSVTSWDFEGNSAQSLFAYSWADNNTIIVTTGFGAIADLVPQPYILLPSTYNFTTATSSLPRHNQGYFYMNMGSFLSWVYGFVPSTLNNQNFRTFKQIVGTIHSISATNSATVNREQFDALVVLAPARKQKSH